MVDIDNSNTHEKLIKLKEKRIIPSLRVYNRIDGPGSSLDLRLFQQSFWKLTNPKKIEEDVSMSWSMELPRTVGMSISIGTTIEAHPISKGKLGIESLDFGFSYILEKDKIPPKKENWLLRIMSLFDLDGVKFVIKNNFPELKSAGLGGSAAVTTGVALLANKLTGNKFSDVQIIGMASILENDLGVSITGTQEQSCAVYGGVMDYLWFPWGVPGEENSYGTSIRQELIKKEDYSELRKRFDIYFTMERYSSDVNTKWIEALKTTNGFQLHRKKCLLAYKFREGIRNKNWESITPIIEEYREIRTQLSRHYMCDPHIELKNIVSKFNATCFPLGGGGGSVLVYSPEPEILKEIKGILEKKFRYLEYEFMDRGHEFFNLEEFD